MKMRQVASFPENGVIWETEKWPLSQFLHLYNKV